MLVNIAMREGIDRGADALARRGKGGADPNSPDGQAARKLSRQTGKRARQALRMFRRLGRF